LNPETKKYVYYGAAAVGSIALGTAVGCILNERNKNQHRLADVSTVLEKGPHRIPVSLFNSGFNEYPSAKSIQDAYFVAWTRAVFGEKEIKPIHNRSPYNDCMQIDITTLRKNVNGSVWQRLWAWITNGNHPWFQEYVQKYDRAAMINQLIGVANLHKSCTLISEKFKANEISDFKEVLNAVLHIRLQKDR